MTEQVENRCLTRCIGMCCKNMVFYGTTDSELAMISSSPIRQEKSDDILDIVFHSRESDRVVFVADGKGTNMVGVKGKCPNLGPMGCTIYEERPNACRNLVVGQSVCISSRKKGGLKPLG